MSQRIYRSCEESKRERLSWDEKWKGSDKGMITCWEVGRAMRAKDPELAKRAENGELPVLGWKGGVEKKTKKGAKYGTFYYLAQWQGLRDEALDLDLSQATDLTCSRTEVKVTYTDDIKKYGGAQIEDERH